MIQRLEKLSKARNEHEFKNVWTIDGKILFKENGSNKVKLLYVKWNKRHVELWGIRDFYVLCFFTHDGVRNLFGIIWD